MIYLVKNEGNVRRAEHPANGQNKNLTCHITRKKSVYSYIAEYEVLSSLFIKNMKRGMLIMKEGS
jgi:hypothetical protein